MTLLQLVDMYQAIGNGGVLVAPTLIAGTTTNGSFTPNQVRRRAAVMKPTTAATLLGMFRATTQDGDFGHRGTAPKAQRDRLPGGRQDGYRAAARREPHATPRR